MMYLTPQSRKQQTDKSAIYTIFCFAKIKYDLPLFAQIIHTVRNLKIQMYFNTNSLYTQKEKTLSVQSHVTEFPIELKSTLKSEN